MAGYKDPPKKGQWQKGQSGNPNGKKKGTLSSKVIIAKWLKMDSGEDGEDGLPLKNFDKMVRALIQKAQKGDVQAFEKILDRLEGRPTQYLANDPENPLISSDVREKLAKRVKELSTGNGKASDSNSNGQGS